MFFAGRYLNYRYRLGYKDGLEEGRKEGIQLGRIQERARWEVYRQAVNATHRKGEPPPDAPPDEEIWNEYVSKWIDL